MPTHRTSKKSKRRIAANELLPKYVTSFRDRHGKLRLKFRRKGYEPHSFQHPYGTKEFDAEYIAANGGGSQTPPPRPSPYAKGSIGDLRSQYFKPITRLGPSETTQKKVARIINDFCDGREDRLVADIEFIHIDAIIAKKQVKRQQGNRVVGGVEAARKLRKELVRFFAFAKKLKLITDNPADDSERVKVPAGERSKGFHTWTEEEIAQYRAQYPLGTNARLALEQILWTDQRRGDAIHLGRQHIVDGFIKVTQSKGGKLLWLPVAVQWIEAIEAMGDEATSPMCFLLNDAGMPFTNAAFGNWFREKCDGAGLHHCTAHGLRKATMRRMAELQLGNQTMKSVSGHTKDNEVALYTAEANQKRMATAAIKRLSAWEKRFLAAEKTRQRGQLKAV
ncbi:integrase [Sphingopyxis panaciterrae]|uniref:tyrosine-type recombinase/integrase n=1 Tax=Sphingopyxis panaciterrae TaxID=363841 RepID=UPI001FBB0DD0|nr:tyrosine-type recombinase/integrase [Sphingopyxis panaciterrae]NIJ37878.1 integrase [Sphingopyxis panaciterrae]